MMTQPITLDARTARFRLPYLYAGQAQKEVQLNEALARLDGLLHPVIEGVASTPPAEPTEGESWVVGENATGAWIDREDQIACFQAGTWLYTQATNGMRVIDRASGNEHRFDKRWKEPDHISAPAGGNVIDVEARQAVQALIVALVRLGQVRQDQPS